MSNQYQQNYGYQQPQGNFYQNQGQGEFYQNPQGQGNFYQQGNAYNNNPQMYAGSNYNNRQMQPVYENVVMEIKPVEAKPADVKPVVNLENNNTNISREALRKGFIRKVLFILIIQLIVTTVAIAVTFIDKQKTRQFLQDHQYGLYIALVISLITIFALACFRKIFRKVPWNYLLLTLYTLSTAYFLASIAAVSESTSVLFAGGFTLFAVFTISCYAWKTKKDLTKKMSGLISVTSILFMILIFGLIFRSRIINVIIGAAFGVVFSFLFAVNVQRLSGRYESKFSLDDYVIAALDLYIDIVQIFLSVFGVANFVNK